MHFRANRFSFQEWPLQDFINFKDFSIGEELSESRVIALGWSPEGLAKHQRSCLAVLTSNLLLHLWASPSDPAVERSWQRVLIINETMKAHFEAQSEPDDGKDGLLIRKKRVRAAAWATRPGSDVSFKVVDHSSALLAVLNDDAEVLILEIFYDNTDSLETSATVATSFRMTYPESDNFDGSLETLKWSQWTRNDQGLMSTITCRQHETLHFIQVAIDASEAGRIAISLSQRNRLELCEQAEGPPQLLKAVIGSARESLTKAVASRIRRFTNKHNLLEDAQSRCWGNCRWQTWLAFCFTIHPSDQIEYTTGVHERACVIFAADAPKQPLKFDWEEPALEPEPEEAHVDLWEAFLQCLSKFSTQTPVHNGVLTSTSPTGNARSPENGIDEAVQPLQDAYSQKSSIQNTDQQLFYTNICAGLFFQPEEVYRKLGDGNLGAQLANIFVHCFEEQLELAGSLRNEHSQSHVAESINRLIQSAKGRAETEHLEHCQMCGDVLLWIDPYVAQCPQGHMFGMGFSFWEIFEVLTRVFRALQIDFPCNPRAWHLKTLRELWPGVPP